MICERGCHGRGKAQILYTDWDGTLLCPQCGYEDYRDTKESIVVPEVSAYIRRVPKYIREQDNV